MHANTNAHTHILTHVLSTCDSVISANTIFSDIWKLPLSSQSLSCGHYSRTQSLSCPLRKYCSPLESVFSKAAYQRCVEQCPFLWRSVRHQNLRLKRDIKLDKQRHCLLCGTDPATQCHAPAWLWCYKRLSPPSLCESLIAQQGAGQVVSWDAANWRVLALTSESLWAS